MQSDTITAAAGWHEEKGRTVSLLVVTDDRLHAGCTPVNATGTWRLAHDPKQNFSTQDATRFVAVVRF